MNIARRGITLVLLLAIAGGLVCGAVGMALAPGQPAPELRGKTPAGERFVLDYGAAEVTLVNFWATWCQPCLKEMPALQQLHERLGGDRFRLVGVVNENIGPEAVQKFLDDLEIRYPCILPQEKYLARWGGITSMPTSFLIDRQGKVLRRYIGATEKQVAGLIYDVEAVVDGRPLGPFVFDDGGVVDERDRPEAPKPN